MDLHLGWYRRKDLFLLVFVVMVKIGKGHSDNGQ